MYLILSLLQLRWRRVLIPAPPAGRIALRESILSELLEYKNSVVGCWWNKLLGQSGVNLPGDLRSNTGTSKFLHNKLESCEALRSVLFTSDPLFSCYYIGDLLRA